MKRVIKAATESNIYYWNGVDEVPKDVVNVVIEDGVKEIRLETYRSPFDDLKQLKSITLPSSLEKVCKYLFAGCTSLTEIIVDPSNRYFSSIDGNLYNKRGTTLLQYAFGKSNTEFIIPDTVKDIYFAAFTESYNLKSVVIPGSVKKLGAEAFAACESLERVIIESGVTKISQAVFYECRNLKQVELPDTLTIIGNRAFQLCKNLIDINIPKSVTNIGTDAFVGCESLTNIAIPEGLQRLGAYAFYRCKGPKTLVVPPNIDIRDATFCGCDGIESVIVSEGVTTIPRATFFSCENLKKVILPDSLKSIRQDAFYNCHSLIDINISEKVRIGKNAFEGCDKLNIDIPEPTPRTSNNERKCIEYIRGRLEDYYPEYDIPEENIDEDLKAVVQECKKSDAWNYLARYIDGRFNPDTNEYIADIFYQENYPESVIIETLYNLYDID